MVSNQSLASFSKEHNNLLESQLEVFIQQLQAPNNLKESMLYSLKAGGKRIRPLLLFATLRAFGIDTKVGAYPAAAIEMIHTYSLIHDDLPSMDDDDLRRGKPTNHKVFGEAMAILAGDGLLTYSFEVLSQMPDHDADSRMKIALINLLAKSAGAEGMVGGQVADIEGEGKQLNLEDLEYIHLHKTGKLLVCSVMSGAILAKANEDQAKNLEAFARHLGMAFQIRDDILDVEGNQELIGKPLGSDTENLKSTYPALLTMEGAKAAMNQHYEAAKQHLRLADLDSALLGEIADLVVAREY
ncbi:polyprenyl synthetase family protein [Neobacillus sp. LXY-4]|uniref:polyprenyl synthetase family protein n=1 Tax=Neobacillus sp. LXY-4 TaxID=3379826 RepID=UPI003EE14547